MAALVPNILCAEAVNGYDYGGLLAEVAAICLAAIIGTIVLIVVLRRRGASWLWVGLAVSGLFLLLFSLLTP